ncbi:MAG TPA: FAD-binding oxidoreductase, partial [Chitinophagales bacterium]|nr:FAD-binding oxidoreductase [Chitinophagales bacterium]
NETNKITGWGKYPVVQSNVFEGERPEAVSDYIKESDFNITPRGNGRSYGDAGLGARVISSLKLSRILTFDRQAGELSCQSGVLLSDILELIIPVGYFLPVMPGTKFITVGGAVAADVHGKNHFANSSFCSHVSDIKLLTGNGELINCSPAENSKLFYATCGGMGLTGFIAEVRFSLMKIETAYIQAENTKCNNLKDLFAAFNNVAAYKVAWLDCFTGRGIFTTGNHILYKDLQPTLQKYPLVNPAKLTYKVPFTVPSWVINNALIKFFNKRRWDNAHTVIKQTVSLDAFFCPLDAVLHWNRLYGPNGFVQYQYVLPSAVALDGTNEILSRINTTRHKCLLAVIKQFGECEGKSPLSFPMEGFTVALDFKIQPGLFALLDELDKLVVKFGGRLYLAKDARMDKVTMQQGYPGLADFKKVVELVNPTGRFTSAQCERIGYLK